VSKIQLVDEEGFPLVVSVLDLSEVMTESEVAQWGTVFVSQPSGTGDLDDETLARYELDQAHRAWGLSMPLPEMHRAFRSGQIPHDTVWLPMIEVVL
jgi:hypothetical protein